MPDSFQTLVESAAGELGHPVVRWLPAGVLVETPRGTVQELNLVNLARRVRPLPEDDWPGVVRDFLAALLAAPEEFSTLADVAASLRPRLGRATAGQSHDRSPWALPVPGTDLCEHLVVDAPRSMSYVTAADIANSPHDADHWLGVAAANLAAATPSDWLTPIEPDSPVFAGNAGDGYDAARALLLDRLTTPTEAGFVVAVPARDWLFALAVNPQASGHLAALARAAGATFETDPYPISPELYWVRPLVGWEQLASVRDAGAVEFRLPSDLERHLKGH